MHNFKELVIWKEGMDLAKKIFAQTRNFPPEDKFTLTSQILRSAISIPSNIAEGAGRSSNKEFKHFADIAIGSSYELETQLLLAKDFNYLSSEEFEKLNDQLIKLQKMIFKFRNIIQTNTQITKPSSIIN
jgi:four helix bundle protein